MQIVQVEDRVIWNRDDGHSFNTANEVTSSLASLVTAANITLPILSALDADHIVTGANASSSRSLFSQLDFDRSPTFDDLIYLSDSINNPQNACINLAHDAMVYVGDDVLAAGFDVGDTDVVINQIRLKLSVYCPPRDNTPDWNTAGTFLDTQNNLPGSNVSKGFAGNFKVALIVSESGDPSSIADDIIDSGWIAVSSLESQVRGELAEVGTDNHLLAGVESDPNGINGVIMSNGNDDSPDFEDRHYRNLQYVFEIPNGQLLEKSTGYHVLLYGENAYQLGWNVGTDLTRVTNHANISHDFSWNESLYYAGVSWLTVNTTTGWTGNQYPKYQNSPNCFDNTFETISSVFSFEAGDNSGKLVHKIDDTGETTAPTGVRYFHVDFGCQHSDGSTDKAYYISYSNSVSNVHSPLSSKARALATGDNDLIGRPVLLSGIQSSSNTDKVNIWRASHSGVVNSLVESDDLYRVTELDLETGSTSIIDNTTDAVLTSSADNTTLFTVNRLVDKDDIAIGLSGMTEWNERVWGFNGKTLRFSDRLETESYLGQVGDAIYDSYHPENSLDFNDDIKSIVSLTDGLVVFFADKVKVITGGYQVLNPPPDLAIRDISMTDGIFGLQTAVSFKGQVVFANQHKEIKLLSPTGAMQEISDLNQSLMDSFGSILTLSLIHI